MTDTSNVLETIQTPEQSAAAALAEAMAVVTRAKQVLVTDDASYRVADEACGTIKAAMKRADAERDGWVRPLNTQVKRINAGFKDIENAYNAALAAYRAPMTAYQTVLAKARQKAEEEAAAERKRLEAIAEVERQKTMAALLEAQEQATAAARTEAALDPFDAALAEGEATAAAAKAEEAKAEEAKAAYLQAVRDTHVEVAVAYTPKVTGSGSKSYTIWEYEITDPELVPMVYRPIDTAMVAAEVKRSKGETSIPGIRVFSHTEVK